MKIQMIRLKQLLFEQTGKSEITVNGAKIPGIRVDSPNARYEWIFFIADDGNYYGARKNDPTRWVNLNVMSRSEYKDMVARIESWVPANIQRVKPTKKDDPKKDNTQSNASDDKNVETEPEDTDTNASDYKKVETDPSKDTGSSDVIDASKKKPKAIKYKRKLLRVRELDGKVKTLKDWAAFYKLPASEIQGLDPKMTFRHIGLIAQYDVNDTDEAAQHDLWYNNKEARQKVGGQYYRSFDIPGAPEGYRYTTYLIAAGDYERAYAEMIDEWKPFKWKQLAKLGYSVNPGAPASYTHLTLPTKRIV